MQKGIRGLLPLFVIIGAFLTIGAVLISSGVLPEEQAQNFRPLTTIAIPSDMKVIQEPSLDENVFVYAVNEVAERGIDIAKGDIRVKQILDQAARRQAAVTVAAVQPTVIADRETGELLHSSAGQVVITANWQTVGGTLYREAQSFEKVAGQSIESHQQIWHVLVDVDDGKVTQINSQADRIISDKIRPNFVRSDVNMFVPNAVVVNASSSVRWSNPSSLPHNVVGIFNRTTAEDATSSTGLIPDNSTTNSSGNSNKNTNSSSSIITSIDSGFIQPGMSWQYRFDEAGVFNYLCTIHAEEGMRGTLVITEPS